MKYCFEVSELLHVKVCCPDDAGVAEIFVPAEGAVVGLAYADEPNQTTDRSLEEPSSVPPLSTVKLTFDT